jgi:hypothetical protein
MSMEISKGIKIEKSMTVKKIIAFNLNNHSILELNLILSLILTF